jgi:hypothetical protein
MKIVIRITSRLRSMAPSPKGFHSIAGLEHLGLLFTGTVFTDAVEFNAAVESMKDPHFKAKGCEFAAYALTPSDEAKLKAGFIPAPDEPIEAPAPVIEEATEAPAFTEVPDEPIDAIIPATLGNPEFTLDGKQILFGNERIAGLWGDEKQLRVLSSHNHLRPAIEAWLLTITTPEDLL